ncbi:MAG: alpha-amylase family glycosyl hydrolase [Anaerolineae bacterium]|nr:alpha-amylase family glycosyl hydrolase [Anaerolineae bacterium]
MRDEIIERIADKVNADIQSANWQQFVKQLNAHYPTLYRHLHALYGHSPDFPWHIETILLTAAKMWQARPAALKALDAERGQHPTWYQSQQQLGGVCYVDLFAGNLNGVRAKIPYFKELGLTYLHLMPLFDAPKDNNDGGYAVSSYRDVYPTLGNMPQLIALADELRANGIALCLDFIFNHTSNEHIWAQKALAGDPHYRDFYLIFPDRTLPDQYERTLREIFPDEHPGAFSPLPDISSQKSVVSSQTEKVSNLNLKSKIQNPKSLEWVWTTFHTFQWDLNYANPAVFNAMSEEMLFIANLGIEILRMDAVAFIWKQMGTTCENLPQAHTLIQAFNAMCRIAAPSLLFKSEAIVHPDDVVKYISTDECQLSYNPLLMALLWESLATRQVRLLRKSLEKGRFQLPPNTAWVNYVRCHDDIGWTFSDEDAAELGINGYDHRRFLNNFYTARFPGSFAQGLPFQENPKTGDCRISGMCAALTGLEHYDVTTRQHAVLRILLMHGLTLAFGGVPLIYLGDEIGTRNDYSFASDPHKKHDSRWVHRPHADEHAYALRNDSTTSAGRIYQSLSQLVKLRKNTPALGGNQRHLVYTNSDHVLAFERSAADSKVVVVANFSEHSPSVWLHGHTLSGMAHDLISGDAVDVGRAFTLKPYQMMWIVSKD